MLNKAGFLSAAGTRAEAVMQHLETFAILILAGAFTGWLGRDDGRQRRVSAFAAMPRWAR